MRVFVTLLLLLLISPASTLAQGNTEKIYQLAKQTGGATYDELLDLADEQFEAHEDIARFFYYWIGLHITYDHSITDIDLLQANKTHSTEPYVVFEKRNTTCMGFTNLYASFLSYFGILHRTVIGYSKHYANLLKDIKPGLDHAWSAIWINDQWQLTDVTWGNYFINDELGKDHFFMTDPRSFANDHLPLDEEWLLYEGGLSLSAFEASPIASPFFYGLVGNPEELVTVSENSEGQKVISIPNVRSWKLSLRAVNANNEITGRLKYKIRYRKGRIIFTLKNHDPKLILRLDARRTTMDGSYYRYDGLIYIKDLNRTRAGSKFSGFSTKQLRQKNQH